MKKNEKKLLEDVEKMFWDVYANNTSTLSSICRQLAFAIGGICWFFLSTHKPFDMSIKIILTFLIFFFVFDVLQYYALATYNKIIAELYESLIISKQLTKSNSIIRPQWINDIANFCFGIKLISLFIASLVLISRLYSY